eukprot:TRINITY_DN1839_c0_g2_i12.p1 TRINITY_DN1839_c0_g2~~TRINITY_DN1839_c0_g2_i12.p1  ORF type:complete len:409 (-),score=33.93 TRINITY_DN1839_c0_g2_i12:182-1408(-)
MNNAVLLLMLSGTVLAWDWKIHVLIYMIARQSLVPLRVQRATRKIKSSILAPQEVSDKELKKRVISFINENYHETYGTIQQNIEVLELIDRISQAEKLVNEMREFSNLPLSRHAAMHPNIDTSGYKKYQDYAKLGPLLVAAWSDDIELMALMNKNKKLSRSIFSPYTHFLYQCPNKRLKLPSDNIMSSFSEIKSALEEYAKSLAKKSKTNIDSVTSSYMMAHFIHIVGDMHQPTRMGTQSIDIKRRKEEGCHHNEGGFRVSVIEKVKDLEVFLSGEKFGFRWKLREIWDKAINLDFLSKDLPKDKKIILLFEDEAERLINNNKGDAKRDRQLLVNSGEFAKGMEKFAADFCFSGVNLLTEDVMWSGKYEADAKKEAEKFIARAGYTLAEFFKDIYFMYEKSLHKPKRL